MGEACVIIARQAGSAAAFAPLIHYINAQNILKLVEVLAHPTAKNIFNTNAITAREINGFDEHAITTEPADIEFLLTGTSEHVVDDAKYWQWAREHKIPSIAFVDGWVNYWQRFTRDSDGHNKFDLTPDFVAVIDEIAKQRLMDLGLNADKIIITNLPALDGLNVEAEVGQAFRMALTPKPNETIVLFACDALINDDKFISMPPMDKAIDYLIKAAQNIANPDLPITIIIKPHPRQSNKAVFLPFEQDKNGLKVLVQDGDKFAMLFGADIITSPTSMMLYESAAIGKATISIQPHKFEVWDLTDNRKGIDICVNVSEVKAALQKHLRNKNQKTMPKRADFHYSQLFFNALWQKIIK